MRKSLAILLSLILAAALFTGCAKAKDAEQSAEEAIVQAAEGIAGDASDSAQSAAQAASDSDTASAFYIAYIDAKTAVLNRIMDGLTNNPDTMMSALSFLGITMSDLYLLPATYFGLGETSVTAALAVMGGKDVTYEENGNTYTVRYKNSDDSEAVFTGTYDKGKSLISVGSTSGVENVFSEIYRTSFGYNAQFYFISDDGTATLYQISISGENGVIGITTGGDRPAALSGSEAADFPKTAKEWYAIDGDTITGVNSDGEAVNFEYVPSETEG